MNRPLRFLILTASTGNGHISASTAIKEELESRGCVVQVINVMDHVVKAFRKYFQGGYETLVRRGPSLWGYLYRTSDRPLFNYGVQTFLDWKCSYPIDQMIRDFQPDWIINTHSVAQPRLPKIQKELGIGSAVVVTDLYPHRMWLRGSPDHYFVPNEYSKEVLERRIPRIHGHVDVTGIPINAAFANPPDRVASRSNVNLSDEDVAILVTSGGIGAGPFTEVVGKLRDTGCKLLVVCGRSEEAQQSVASQFGNDSQIQIFGHVSQAQMAELMAACDILVGKSGGLTTFESLAVGCPFVVYEPFLIPGQEEDNAKWMESKGAGVTALNLEELISIVEDLKSHPEKRDAMRKAAKELSKPDATKRIADRLIELCRSSQDAVVLSG